MRGVDGRQLAQVQEVAGGEVGDGVDDGGLGAVVARCAQDLEDGRAEEGVEEGGWWCHFVFFLVVWCGVCVLVGFCLVLDG